MNPTTHPLFPTKVRHLALKRGFDIAFSLAVLTLCFPLLLLIALSVKITSKGPLIYKHSRIGRGGMSFPCYKFRTMHCNADQRLKELLETNPQLKQEWQEKRKLSNDPRVTHLGKFLRKTSLDELPQFWNVLRGDLSIVGPRAVVIDELECYFGKKAKKILTVRPGITGLWQVQGRSNTSYSHRVALDEYYIDHQSFLLDLKIVAKTVPVVILSKGAC